MWIEGGQTSQEAALKPGNSGLKEASETAAERAYVEVRRPMIAFIYSD